MAKNGNIQKVIHSTIPTALIVLILVSIFGRPDKDNKELESWAHLISDNYSVQINSPTGHLRNNETGGSSMFNVDDFASSLLVSQPNGLNTNCCAAYINTNNELVVVVPNFDGTTTTITSTLQELGIEKIENFQGLHSQFIYRFIATQQGPTMSLYDYNSMRLYVLNPITLDILEMHDFRREIALNSNIDISDIAPVPSGLILTDSIHSFVYQLSSNGEFTSRTGLYDLATNKYFFLRQGLSINTISEGKDRTIGIFNEFIPGVGRVDHITDINTGRLITSIPANFMGETDFGNNFYMDSNDNIFILTSSAIGNQGVFSTEVSIITFTQEETELERIIDATEGLQFTMYSSGEQIVIRGFNPNSSFDRSTYIESKDINIENITRVFVDTHERYIEGQEITSEISND